MLLDVIADFCEERWPSMDLSAEMLVTSASSLPGVQCSLTRRPMWRLPLRDEVGAPERALARFVQYPLHLLRRSNPPAYFHVADHSYAHLVHCLPRGRTGVYCHDLDAFQDALQRRDSMPRRALGHLLLSGLRRADLVFHSTQVVRRELLEAGLVEPGRLVQAPFGISAEFQAEDTEQDVQVRANGRFVLNVGSCIPRKNVGFLLRVFAGLQSQDSGLKLVQIGGRWTSEQLQLLTTLGLGESVVQLGGLTREELAAYYRQARLVLLPTLAEGFGLPLIEALGCGAHVLASKLPVLEEVGAGGASFAEPNQLGAWLERARSILLEQPSFERRHQVAQMTRARYSWAAHAETIVGAYARLAERERSS